MTITITCRMETTVAPALPSGAIPGIYSKRILGINLKNIAAVNSKRILGINEKNIAAVNSKRIIGIN